MKPGEVDMKLGSEQTDAQEKDGALQKGDSSGPNTTQENGAEKT